MPDKFIARLEDIKAYLRIDLAELKYDRVLNMLNENITASIQNWIGRDIITGTYNEEFDITFQQQSVFLKQYPVTSVVGVTHNGTLLTEDTDYYTYTDTGIIKIVPSDTRISHHRYSKDFFYEGLKNVEVCYVAGYAATAIPEAIKQATLKLINREFYDRGVDDIESFTGGGQSYKRLPLSDGMPMGVYTLLHPYRRQFG